jgi:YVTN family beta-propeller protein
MQPLHPNDVSKETVAAIYALPMSVLPTYLNLLGAAPSLFVAFPPGTTDADKSAFEHVQCLVNQCVGFMLDGSGNAPNWISFLKNTPTNWLNPPYDATATYKFVGAYFDPLTTTGRQTSAALDVITLLHEYAHYLDGTFGRPRAGRLLNTALPHWGLLDKTNDFYTIGYDLTSEANGCFSRRTNNPMDWLTRYGFRGGSSGCVAGKYPPVEDFADSFAYYVTSGRDFRAAATQSTMIRDRYDWLKANVFENLEYDTDLPGDVSSGCNDVYNEASNLPGYTHCNDNYIWDFTLPHGLVNGSCGNAEGGAWGAWVKPTENLCASGSPTTSATGSGPWNWTCRGLNGGTPAACTANLAVTPSAPQSVTAVGGAARATVNFTPPAYIGASAIISYTATSSPGGIVGPPCAVPCASITVVGLTPGTAYTFTVTASNSNGTGPPSPASNSATPVSLILALESFETATVPALPAGWLSTPGIGINGLWGTNIGTRTPSGRMPHSGANLAYFNGHDTTVRHGALLISKAFSLTGVTGAKVSFWMYRDANFPTENDQVEIRINTSPALSNAANVGSSAVLGTVHRYTGSNPAPSPVGSPESGWYHFVYDIPAANGSATYPTSYNGDTNYLIFTAENTGGDVDIHLDDIVVATIPTAPVIVGATPGVGEVTIAFSPPMSDGGAALSSYTVTCTGASTRIASATTSPITVTGLTAPNVYSCSVTATSAVGAGAASSPINAVAFTSPLITSAGSTSFAVNSAATFNVTASGIPAPALAVTGALPAGVTFENGTALTGTPALGTVGSYALTFSASNGAPPDYQQSFILTVQKASQSIDFGPAPILTVGRTGVISSYSSSGLQTTLQSTTPAVCMIYNPIDITVVALGSGTCIIAADQAGNADYLAAAQTSQSFTIATGPPGVPTQVSALPGSGQLQLTFAPPVSDGGNAITGYSATCNALGASGGVQVTGNASPLIMPSLSNGTTYTCTLAAINFFGSSAADNPALDPVFVATPGSVLAPFTFIPNNGSGNVSVLEIGTRKVVATVAVGAWPVGVALNPAGTRAYVTNNGSNTVSVIDTANFATANLTVGNQPYGIAINPTGTEAYVAVRGDNTVRAIDLASGSMTSIPVGAAPSGVVFHPSGRFVYVTNFTDSSVSVIDTTTKTVIRTVLGAGLSAPFGLAIHPAGTSLYAVGYGNDALAAIDTATFAILAIPVGSEPLAVAINPSGDRAYVTNGSGNTVSVINTASNTVVATVTGLSMPFGLQVDAAGELVYVANSGNDSLSIIDASGNVVTATIALNIPSAAPAGLGNFIQPIPTLEVTSVVSRKIHGALGNFDLVIDTSQPVTGAVSVEPRASNVGHTIVFKFNGLINAFSKVSAKDSNDNALTATAAVTGNSNEVVVTLPLVPDKRRVKVTLTNVNGVLTTSASIGFLVGNVSNSLTVNAADITSLKSRSGQATDSINFRFDVNTSGVIGAGDIGAAKARVGNPL